MIAIEDIPPSAIRCEDLIHTRLIALSYSLYRERFVSHRIVVGPTFDEHKSEPIGIRRAVFTSTGPDLLIVNPQAPVEVVAFSRILILSENLTIVRGGYYTTRVK